MAAVALHKRPFDLLILVFLLVHIPVTVFIDSQACEPTSCSPTRAMPHAYRSRMNADLESLSIPSSADGSQYFRGSGTQSLP